MTSYSPVLQADTPGGLTLVKTEKWDDDADNDGKSDSLFGAPTVATVVDVGVAVALTAAGAGPLAVAALSLVDDVLFTTADVATGYQDAAATFGQLGIRAVTSVAGAATGGLINGVGGQHASGFLVQGLSGTIGSGVTNTVGAAAIDAGFAMATSGINTVMAAGITTAFTGGEWDDFTGGLDSWEHWRGTVTAGVRGAAGSLAGDFFTQDGTGETIVAGTSIDTKALAGAASLSTTAITAGAEYAITGRTTVNLAALNFKYQADGRESTSSTGLLELRLGGAGSSLHLGTGGYRADLGTIAKTIGGRSDVLGVTRAKLAGEGSHALGVLNTSNYLAIGGMRQLSQEIWGRKVAVAFEDLGEDYGYYHHSEDPNRIVINRRSNTNDREDVAVLAAGAAHEGQHRYDRTFHGRTNEYSAHRSGAAVYLNLMHGLGLKGNDRLMQSIAAGLMSEQSKQTNTGPVDHWRRTADGGVAFTKDGWLKTEDEQFYINSDGSRTPVSEGPIPGLTIGAEGIETGLLRILTGRNDEQYSGFSESEVAAAQQMMIGAGLDYYVRGSIDTPEARYWYQNPLSRQTIGAEAMADAGFEGMNRYLPTSAPSGSSNIFGRIAQSDFGQRVGNLSSGLWDRASSAASNASSWFRGLFGREEVSAATAEDLADQPWSPHQNFEPGSSEMQENLEHFQEPLDPSWQEALIAELDPSMQAQARAVLNQAQFEGIKVRADLAYRSPEDQEIEFAKGRDAEGNIVDRSLVTTFARAGESAHQYGFAMDVRMFDENGVSNWDYFTNPDWDRFADIVEMYGLFSGRSIDTDPPDYPHVQTLDFNYLDYLGR